MEDTALRLTSRVIDCYINGKLDRGVSPPAAAKYADALRHLKKWLGEDSLLTLEKTKAWRKYLEDSGYSKSTVQGYVKRANDFFRTMERPDLCIPKPLRLDIRGQTFGRLTAVEPTEKRNRSDILWRCTCQCGREAEFAATHLVCGNARSCGHCSRSDSLRRNMQIAEGTSIRKALAEDAVSTRNASGYTCVYKKRDKWTAIVIYKKRRYNLGTFERVEDAAQARAEFKEKIQEDARLMEQVYAYLFEGEPL